MDEPHSPIDESHESHSPLLEESPLPSLLPVAKRVAPFAAAAVVAVGGLGYAVHEHHAAQNLATANSQMTAQLAVTHGQLDALTAKVNSLVADASKPSPATPSSSDDASTDSSTPTAARAATPAPVRHQARAREHRPSATDLRFKKMQSQLDAQGKAIEDQRNDLTSAKTELGGSIARTHDELVVLEKKGERSYFEFDLNKSKNFQRTGPLSVSLRKANEKHQYADLDLIVSDRTVTQKHVNLDQPVMYYQNENGRPIEIVINSITKNHIHGYISAPKYRQSELTADSGSSQGTDQAANGQPSLKQRPTTPDSDQH